MKLETAVLITAATNTTLEFEIVEYCKNLKESSYTQAIEKLANKVVDEPSIKTVYLDKGCTIPRVKTRNFCSSNSIKIIRDHSKADAHFISLKAARYAFSYHGYYSNSKKEAIIKLDGRGKYDSIVEAMKKTSSDKILVKNWSLRYNVKNELFDSYDSVNALYINNRVVYDKVLDSTSNLYLQDDFMKKCNSGIVIDQAQYENLKLILSSEDKGNVTVAMEVLANCDYLKSIAYIFLLFKECYESAISSHPDRTHVNFKGLLEYLEIPRWNLNKAKERFTLKCMVDNLRSKDLLTRDNVDILIPGIDYSLVMATPKLELV